MPSTRRQRLEAMLVDDPRDPFLRYGLALELEKEGAADRGLELLAELVREQPPYVPAFFMSAQVLHRHNRIADARTMLRQGVDAARAAGDHHAAGEMAEFLAQLGQSGE